METETEQHVAALTEASILYEAIRVGVSVQKGKQVEKLARFGVFTDYEIAAILSTTMSVVNRAADREGVHIVRHQRRDHGAPVTGSTLEALKILAHQYHVKKFLSYSLLGLVMGGGPFDYLALQRVTGIPTDTARKVMYGGTYVSGVLTP